MALTSVPPVPKKDGTSPWTAPALYALVFHCAEVTGTLSRLRYTVTAWMRIIIRDQDGNERREILEVRQTMKIKRGVTQKSAEAYARKRLAWTLARCLYYGFGESNRIPIQGVWVVHLPSQTRTWLKATPYHSRSKERPS